jgi:receptor expression-enhancing protein 1/2/3/4
MIVSVVTRFMTLMLGYLYPAYECFKTVEQTPRPDLEGLRFWCRYWIIIATVTVLERAGGDFFISWLPLYSEAKLAFIVYLWHPQTKGTSYVYATFVRPFVAKYEEEIDGNLGELRVRAGEIALVYWQRGSTIFQARFVELLQFLASQSPGRVPYVPPPQPNVYPPRGNSSRLQTTGSGDVPHRPSAPPPPGYPAPPPQGYQAPPGVPYPAPPSAPYPAPSSGTYPAPPPGYPSVLNRSGPAGPGAGLHQRSTSQPPPPAPGQLGAPRPRASTADEDDEFELIYSNNGDGSAPQYLPDDQASGPNGYMTRARQRAERIGDRGRAPGSF